MYNIKFIGKKCTDLLDINNLSTDKNLDDLESPLEFFIVSLSRSLDLKPRQAVALLANSREYLIQIANKGINGDFAKINNWYQDVLFNYETLVNIIKSSNMRDKKAISYATLSVGLFSKNEQIAKSAFSLLKMLESDIATDLDWLIKEGIEAFIFCANKYSELRPEILNLIYKMAGKDDELINKEFFNTKKFTNAKIYEFLLNILEHLRLLDAQIIKNLKNYIIDFCLKETSELASAVVLLADSWVLFELNNENDDEIIDSILKFFKNSIREKGQRNLQYITLIQLFRILKNLDDVKDSNAPVIYRTLAFLFLENYDEKFLREAFLNNFIHLFDYDKSIPIDILLEPFLRQIRNSNNFDIIDFNFLSRIYNHPKISLDSIKEILDFGFYTSLNNINYARSANQIITQVIEKHLYIANINSLAYSNAKINEIFEDIIKFIRKALQAFLKNPKNHSILEMSYDILNFNFIFINQKLENDIIEAVEGLRKKKGQHSMGLLALLWFYDSHDDVLLTLEEKYTDKQDKYYINLENRVQEKKKNKIIPTSSKPQEVIKALVERRDKENKIKEESEIKKKEYEKKLIKNLAKKILDKSADAARSILETNLVNITNLENSNIGNPEMSKVNNSDIVNYNYYSNNNKNNSLMQQKIASGDLSKVSNAISYKRNPLSQLKNFVHFANLEDCEAREIIAIEGLFRQFEKIVKKLFLKFSTEVNNTVPRSNFLKMLREVGIENDIITLEELSSLIRLTFSLPLNSFDKKQFDKLLIQVSYLIFSKVKENYPISRCLQEMFIFIERYFLYKNNNESFPSYINNSNTQIKKINKPSNDKVLNYLQSKIENVFLSEDDMMYIFSNRDINALKTEENKSDIESNKNTNVENLKKNLNSEEVKEHDDDNYEESQKQNRINKPSGNNQEKNISESSFNLNRVVLLPPGYKKKLTTKVEFDHSLNKDFALKFLSEAQIICYELLDEIIRNKFNTSIIEPSVKVLNYFQVVEEPIDPKKKWCDKIAITYSMMDKANEFIGKDVGDLLEDMLKAIDKGWTGLERPKFLGPKEREAMEDQQKRLKENEEKDKKRIERKKEIDEKLKKLAEEKEMENKKKESEQKKINETKEKELKLQLQKERELKDKIKSDFLRAKKEKERVKQEKIKLEKQKAEEATKKKEQEKLEFFKNQKKKLKEQMTEMKNGKLNFIKQQQEALNLKLPEVNIKKILEKDKEYIEFEKNLNENIEGILTRNDIKEFLAQYENHFKLIYEIYSRLGHNKITFFTEEAIHINEFKEFCVNFMIFGLLINTEQMTFIFRKVSKRNESTSDDLFFLRYNDFMISLIYICVFLQTTNRSNRRILPSDLDKINISSVKALVEFMGLKLPFNKRELEDFINDRRALSAKQLLKLQTTIRRERSDIVKPSSARRERSSLSLNKIKFKRLEDVNKSQKDLLRVNSAQKKIE